MNRPEARGRCPGAHRPMLSGDGALVRIRPWAGRLTRDQVLGLCAAARAFGSGIIDLTSRANLQLRGVDPAGHDRLLDALSALRLLDPTPEAEARRNIVIAPEWRPGDAARRLYDRVAAVLAALPRLPAKTGVAIDTGPRPVLQAVSADARFERAGAGGLILRADGADLGRPVSEADAAAALRALFDWFLATGGAAAGRMRRHLRSTPLPSDWTTVPPAAPAAPLVPGAAADGIVLGAPFGRIEADALAASMRTAGARALRVTPWRAFILEGVAGPVATAGFATGPDDPLLCVHACPGAPSCAAATVETYTVARALAARHPGLHVSGCAKGCAHPAPAGMTLVGRDGAYDLVVDGHPWDEPARRGLTAGDLIAPMD